MVTFRIQFHDCNKKKGLPENTNIYKTSEVSTTLWVIWSSNSPNSILFSPPPTIKCISWRNPTQGSSSRTLFLRPHTLNTSHRRYSFLHFLRPISSTPSTRYRPRVELVIFRDVVLNVEYPSDWNSVPLRRKT